MRAGASVWLSWKPCSPGCRNSHPTCAPRSSPRFSNASATSAANHPTKKNRRYGTDGPSRCGRARDRSLLLELRLNHCFLLFRFLLVGSEDQLAIERHSLQQEIEPFAVFV